MAFDSVHTFAHQHKALFLLIMFCVWISVSMMGRMWLKYRRDSFLKKVAWSLILCVPFFGWLFYGGCYTPLSDHNMPLPMDPSVSGDSHSH